MRTFVRTDEVLLQGMRDMLHDRGGKRKAETESQLRLPRPAHRALWLWGHSLLIAEYLELQTSPPFF
jgi:hypothetical protein